MDLLSLWRCPVPLMGLTDSLLVSSLTTILSFPLHTEVLVLLGQLIALLPSKPFFGSFLCPDCLPFFLKMLTPPIGYSPWTLTQWTPPPRTLPQAPSG